MRLAGLPGGALELHLYSIDQAPMVVGDDEIDARQATPFEPDKVLHPAALRFAVTQLQPQDLAVAGFIDANGHQGAACSDSSPFADLEDQRIHEHKRIALLAQVPLVPGAHQ